MSTLNLDAETDARLAALAQATGRTPTEIVHDAVADYLHRREAEREAAEAKAWLTELRKTAVVGDVMSPSGEAWNAEHGHL